MLGIDPQDFKEQARKEIGEAATRKELFALKDKYLGRKGVFASLTGSIPGLSKEERPRAGSMINELKAEVSRLIGSREAEIGSSGAAGSVCVDAVDISMPSVSQYQGNPHPITKTMDDICAVFERMGFAVVFGPEIETEYHNFTALNIPLEHPSRDVFDTFYLEQKEQANRPKGGKLLLRSHTSPVQIRVMESRKPPIAVVVPGRVFRPDAVDASHSFMFHQIEGLMVDEGINFSHLKAVLESFVHSLFSEKTRMRFRPHFFPFTEPSAEVDISCIMCGGRGCSVCGRKGWLEILGSGMVHPDVLENMGIDSRRYTGFAFGLGIERIAMLKYGINDIRLFFENDLRFLRQF
ncbi:MAG: phenylalanine--tRNA ligase subunit alpha [Candidatus Omnitrophica bacterium]|nr:phenylalanine--tRNA ligase subunit alpha [Candidatus Omnitrophota bacterium]